MTLRCRVALARKHWSPSAQKPAVVLLHGRHRPARAGRNGRAQPGVGVAAVWRRRRDWRGGYA